MPEKNYTEVFTKLESEVNRVYNTNKEIPYGDEEWRYCPSLLQDILDIKEEIGDDSEIHGSSIPIELLERYKNLECLQCWLCNYAHTFEFIPVFIWSKNYMYIFGDKGIRMIAMDYTVFPLHSDNYISFLKTMGSDTQDSKIAGDWRHKEESKK